MNNTQTVKFRRDASSRVVLAGSNKACEVLVHTDTEGTVVAGKFFDRDTARRHRLAVIDALVATKEAA